MDDFINVIKGYPKVQLIVKDVSDKYIKLPPIYQTKIGNDTLVQKDFLKELINILGTTIVDKDIEIKMDISKM